MSAGAGLLAAGSGASGGTVALAVTGGALITAGIAMLLERSLTRLVVGILLLGNGVNLLILTGGGPAGRAPILHGGPPEAAHRPMADPLPQIMILTAIVIALASAAFVLAIAYRGGRLGGEDEVRDDIEDRRVARRRGGIRAELERRAIAGPADPIDPDELGVPEAPDAPDASDASDGPDGPDGPDGGAGEGGR